MLAAVHASLHSVVLATPKHCAAVSSKQDLELNIAAGAKLSTACEQLLRDARAFCAAAQGRLVALRQSVAALRWAVAAAHVRVMPARAAVRDAVERDAGLEAVAAAAASRAAACRAARVDVEQALEACGGRGVDVSGLDAPEAAALDDAIQCLDNLEEPGIDQLAKVCTRFPRTVFILILTVGSWHRDCETPRMLQMTLQTMMRMSSPTLSRFDFFFILQHASQSARPALGRPLSQWSSSEHFSQDP